MTIVQEPLREILAIFRRSEFSYVVVSRHFVAAVHFDRATRALQLELRQRVLRIASSRAARAALQTGERRREFHKRYKEFDTRA
jgi:hypothetical protein